MTPVLFGLLALSAAFRILHISDIHYNPWFDPSYPWCQNPTDETRSPDAQHYYYGKIGCNPPMTLVDAILADVRSKSNIDAVVMSGDLISHEVSEAAFKDAFYKVFAKFSEYFGASTPFIFSMGNNDTPFPFNITCSDPYFSFLYTALQPHIPSSQEEIFKRTASYSVTAAGQLFISVNTNLFDPRHSDDCGVLGWLEEQLDLAAANGMHPIIVGHIPPGVSSFDFSTQMNPELQDRFLAILAQYRTTVNSVLLGHVHRDEFRLLPTNTPLAMLVATSVSPVYNNNPGYRIYTTEPNRQSGFDDYTQYTFDLVKANKAQAPVWVESYSFVEEYGVSSITPANLALAKDHIFHSQLLSTLYARRLLGFYDNSQTQIECAITALSTKDILDCTGVGDIDHCIGL